MDHVQERSRGVALFVGGVKAAAHARCDCGADQRGRKEARGQELSDAAALHVLHHQVEGAFRAPEIEDLRHDG